MSIMDASAVLAYLNEEKGADIAGAALDIGPCWITAVNYCEVLGKLCDKGMPIEEATEAVDGLGLSIVPMDRELAIKAAELQQRTARIGASLGDRASLALAEINLGTDEAPVVYTTEQLWTKLRWKFKVVITR